MNSSKDIIEIIKKERKAQNLTGDDMARMLNITQAGYSFIETGKRKLSLSMFVKACNRLGIKIELNKKLN